MSGFDSKLVPGSLLTQKQFMIYRRCKIDSIFTGFHEFFFSFFQNEKKLSSFMILNRPKLETLKIYNII